MVKVLIHGGAWNAALPLSDDIWQTATDRSCVALSLKGRSALDIVEEAVALQELEECLDAGIGSVVQLDGRIRMDAGICDSSGHYGAVVQIEQVATPIKVARRILDIGYHSMLSGEGARLFALEQGFPSVSPYIAETMQEFHETRRQFPNLTYKAITANIEDINKKRLSTVGAVAIDDQGRLAAACSTGGLSFGYPGRVGDTAILGAGVYCSPHVAVACTGEGDKMLRRLTAKRVEEGFLKHGSLRKAADDAVQDLLDSENGYCGLIAVASTGEAVSARSTTIMAFAEKSE